MCVHVCSMQGGVGLVGVRLPGPVVADDSEGSCFDILDYYTIFGLCVCMGMEYTCACHSHAQLHSWRLETKPKCPPFGTLLFETGSFTGLEPSK